MKKIIFAAIVLMAGFSTTAMAEGTAATVAGTTAGATLIVPMTIGQTATMDFGSIVLTSTTAATTVTLPSSSIIRTFGVGVAAGVSTHPAVNAAYGVTGTYNATYALTLPAGDITLTEVGGTNAGTMIVNAFTARFSGAAADAVTSTLSATGTDNFTVGATLNVKVAQTGGIYAGAFPVSVDYN